MVADSKNILSFNTLYETNYHRFIRFAIGYVTFQEVAEDIVNDSFMYYWEHRAHIENDNIPSYMLSVIKNRCLNYLRKLAVEQRAQTHLKALEKWELELKLSMLEACEPDKLIQKEVQLLVQEAIKEMPARTREVFIKSRFKSLTNREIAEELSITVKTVEYHMSNALKIVRNHLKDYFLIWLLLL